MQFEECTHDDVISALNFISADTAREEWVEIGMAIKSEFPESFDIFDAWSQGGGSYKPADSKAAWRSFKAGKGITIATLFKRAIDGGYSPERKELTQEQKTEFAKQRAERQRRRLEIEAEEAAEVDHWHDQNSKAASLAWSKLVSEGKSDYLEAKGVEPYGVGFIKARFMIYASEARKTVNVLTEGPEITEGFNTKKINPDDSFKYLKPGTIVIPVTDESWKVVNLQLIYPSGKKSYLKHGRKSGCFFVLGQIQPDSIIAFAEGYATAATIHAATGWPVVVTFDSGNLVHVTKTFRGFYPNTNFLIAADDDRKTKNAGINKAREAAANVGAVVELPDFGEVANG